MTSSQLERTEAAMSTRARWPDGWAKQTDTDAHRALQTFGVSRQASGGAAVLGAFGCTFILAPACSIRIPAEDSVLLRAFAQLDDMAIVIESEMQARADCWESMLAHLSADARFIYETDNAGGASQISEALSMEVLVRLLGARLVSTELELKYWPSGGPITDFAVEFGQVILGVSVTRAFAYQADGSTYSAGISVDLAEALLRKKLCGVIRSSSTCCSQSWAKQILHVWVSNAEDVNTLQLAYRRLGPETVSNTMVLVTVCTNLLELFTERAKARERSKNKDAVEGDRTVMIKTCKVKGFKDQEHLRILAESDPCKP